MKTQTQAMFTHKKKKKNKHKDYHARMHRWKGFSVDDRETTVCLFAIVLAMSHANANICNISNAQ